MATVEDIKSEIANRVQIENGDFNISTGISDVAYHEGRRDALAELLADIERNNLYVSYLTHGVLQFSGSESKKNEEKVKFTVIINGAHDLEQSRKFASQVAKELRLCCTIVPISYTASREIIDIYHHQSEGHP